MYLIFQQILLTHIQKWVSHFAAVILRKSHFIKAPFKQQSLSALLFQIQYFVHFLKKFLTNPKTSLGAVESKEYRLRPLVVLNLEISLRQIITEIVTMKKNEYL